MYILRWLWEGFGYEEVSPSVVYYTLRVLMLTLSVVLEDWAIQELVPSPRTRRVAVLLAASSYVTWTYQTHTFSNSIETLLVMWSLVLIKRIVEDKVCTVLRNAAPILARALTQGVEAFRRLSLLHLGLLGRCGSIQPNYIPSVPPLTFFRPPTSLSPQVRQPLAQNTFTANAVRRPFSLVFITIFGLLSVFLAVSVDTAFYTPGEFTFAKLLHNPVVTPLNNFIYNSDSANLAQHGIHPRYQHFLVNLPQLLGPAFPLLFFLRRSHLSLPLLSALSGIALLSFFPHQEARFLLPAVPLILSSLRLPRPPHSNFWISGWILFNLALGFLMGTYHQGGIVPVQMHIAKTNETVSHTFWWKTYSPPIWLLNGKNEELKTVDLMGIPGPQMLSHVESTLPPCRTRKIPRVDKPAVYLVAPRSAYFLTPYTEQSGKQEIELEEVWSYRQHLNLDDMDFADDGIWKTLGRVVGDRGLVVWRVSRNCWSKEQ